MGRLVVDITGKRFGDWTVLQLSKTRTVEGKPYWLCRCVCGTEAEVVGNNLKQGVSQACKNCRTESIVKVIRKHDMYEHNAYFSWRSMKTRCDNTNHQSYSNYGGRGIKYDLRWVSFIEFWRDMEEGWAANLTLERKDVNGNYCKTNCIWATRKEQANNRRNTLWVKVENKHVPLTEAAILLGIPEGTLRAKYSKPRDKKSVQLDFTLEDLDL